MAQGGEFSCKVVDRHLGAARFGERAQEKDTFHSSESIEDTGKDVNVALLTPYDTLIYWVY